MPPKRLPTQNNTETLIMEPTERILASVPEIYDGTGDFGLSRIASDELVDMKIHQPRKRVTVMIVGNHSVGKSSFINWYLGETVQKTGVAIETKGFYFITCGRRRETLKGDASLLYFKYLQGLEEFEGIVPNLFTEVSPSRERQFPCVDFIDTPGLVDGDISYSFDIDSIIVWLADHADLILVFFDPIGQALSARTMDVVHRLSEKHSEKMQMYMSKADQIEREDDRQRVLIQITQNVTARIKSTHAFKLPTFFLPRKESEFGHSVLENIPNAIEDVCDEIDKAIKLTMQKNLSALKSDCRLLQNKILMTLSDDDKKKKINQEKAKYGFSLLIFAWGTLGLLLLFGLQIFLLQFPWAASRITSYLEAVSQQPVLPYIELLLSSSPAQSETQSYYVFGLLCLLYLALSLSSKIIWRASPILSKQQVARLKSYQTYIENCLSICDELYSEYFKDLQSVH